MLDINNHSKKYFLDIHAIITIKFNDSPTPSADNVKAMVLPHAGSFFVNPIMDYSFGQVNRADFKKVIVLSTNHNNSSNYGLHVDRIVYDTRVLVNTIALTSQHLSHSLDIFHNEHSFLSVLPYLALLGLPVTLLVIGSYSVDLLHDISMAVDDQTLVICNTDLLHCGAGFSAECPADIEEYNMTTISKIIGNDLGSISGRVCGRAVVETFCELMKMKRTEYSEYTISSSDLMSRESKSSVGYGGILYNKSGIANLRNNYFLRNVPKEILALKIKDLENNYFLRNVPKEILALKIKDLDFCLKIHLRHISGVFVTIKKNERLRGCIGTFQLEDGDILRGIARFTRLAAFSDKRFTPIVESELPFLTFSINYLKNPVTVTLENLFNKFKVGLDGISLYFSDGKNATYLASVIGEFFHVKNAADFKLKFSAIRDSLQEKANSTGTISRIELYECIEI
jgi:AmmeMemoRadiSam system protein B